MYISADYVSGMVNAIEMLLTVDALRFNDAVDPFGHSVVRRFVVFGHTDGDVVFVKHLHISITVVLYTVTSLYL